MIFSFVTLFLFALDLLFFLFDSLDLVDWIYFCRFFTVRLPLLVDLLAYVFNLLDLVDLVHVSNFSVCFLGWVL